jgi:protein-S-isoprenylcysteine O-methyltransferase Ste14
MSERIALSSIAILLFILRLAELLLSNARKEKGVIRHRWTTISLLVSGSLVYGGSAAEAWLWSFDVVWPVSAAGGVLCLARAALKIWAVRTLGTAWSAFIEVREGQRLVREGPYRFVRHPVYLSAFVEVVCIPMIALAPMSAAFAVLIHWPLIWLRTRAEEATLQSQFGEAYEAYRRDVPAFFPLFK